LAAVAPLSVTISISSSASVSRSSSFPLHHLLTIFFVDLNPSSYPLLTLFLPSSYLLLTFFLPSSYLLLTFFLPSSYLLLTFFLPSSYLLLTSFLPSSYLLLTFFLPHSYLILTPFLFPHSFALFVLCSLFLLTFVSWGFGVWRLAFGFAFSNGMHTPEARPKGGSEKGGHQLLASAGLWSSPSFVRFASRH
jgi:hypothetical protein